MDSTTVAQNTCRFCGGVYHAPEPCLMVRAIEYYRDGSLKKVELGPRIIYPTTTWPWISPPIYPSIGQPAWMPSTIWSTTAAN